MKHSSGYMIRTEHGQFATGVEEKMYHFNGYAIKEKFGEQVMMIGALSGRGTFTIDVSTPKCYEKCRAIYKECFELLVEKKISKLYPGEEEKVQIHHFLTFPRKHSSIMPHQKNKIKVSNS